MSKFESAVHNIGHHIVSGLSSFIEVSYEACKIQNLSRFNVDLKTGVCKPDNLNAYKPLRDVIATTQLKYETILTRTSSVKPHEIARATIDTDFLTTDKRYESHQTTMNDIGVWYGHNPIFQLTISIQHKNGQEYHKVFNDHTTG